MLPPRATLFSISLLPHNQVPSGPNPKLDEAVKGLPPKVGVPEWRVLQSAHRASQRSGRAAEDHMEAFRGFFKKVAAMARTRLKVDKSAVQVRVRAVAKRGQDRGGWRGEFV